MIATTGRERIPGLPDVPTIVHRLPLIVIVALVLPGWPPVILVRVVKKVSSSSGTRSEFTVTVNFLEVSPTPIDEVPLPAR